MIQLTYKIQEKLYESNSSLVYRGYSEIDKESKIIKLLKKEYPTPEEVARFKKEYEITKSLTVDGVIKVYSLEKYNNTFYILLEDFGGDSIRNHLTSKKLSLEQFLKLSIRITEILGEIHNRNIIHKDINPSNIIWNPESNIIKIIDFDISTELSHETSLALNPDVLEGTLAYMSPEQTGRMNRDIDYRTDLYSLGVTFYEMLTNRLPFNSTDPLELVHCHIAKKPIPPHELDSKIPKSLSSILVKLMAKTAEERYQTTYGLKWDLEKCLNQLTTNNEVESFEIGQKDISNKFQIPQKLYGREQEVEQLMTAFDSISEGDSLLLLVAGYSGVGKSALVREIQKPIVQKKGYFIEGKFDQFQRNTPYSALIQAFQNLTLQILSQSKENLQSWKEQLLENLGVNAQIIIDLIPEIEYILGKQPAIPELNPTDTKNRFLITFRNFVKVFASLHHPLVIFLDDLQWADIPTLNLIQDLLTAKDIQYLFLIGAYRENEVTEGHPLNILLSDLEKIKPIKKLLLKPLKEETVIHILSDTFLQDLQSTKHLGELIYNKTNGNPYFVIALLTSLEREGHIYFQHEKGCWTWDLESILLRDVSENVVDFMIQEIQKLPLDTLEVLELASCIGNRFDLKTLSMIYQKSATTTAKVLWKAIQKEIINPLDNRYKLVHLEEESMNELDFEINYKFSHDRIQQAAYTLIEEERVKEVHLFIGRVIKKHYISDKPEEKIIDIVSHLNEGRTLITDKDEIIELIQLNLLAARKARFSSAYRSALQYLTIGKELLGENSWTQQYELTFDVFQEYASFAYLCGEYKLAEECCEVMLINSKTKMEKVKIRSMQLLQYAYGRKMNEAIRVGILALNLLGIKISEKPSTISILYEFILTKKKLGKRKIEDLINQPLVTNTEIILAMEIFTYFITPSYLTGNSNLFALVMLKQTNLSLLYGNSPAVASIYAGYVTLLSGMGLLDLAKEFGKLVLKLNEQYNDFESKCRTLALYTIFCQSWNYHWNTLKYWYTQAIEAGLQSGDLLYMSHCCFHILIWDPEEPLNVINEKFKKYSALIESTTYQDALDFIMVHQNYRLCLCDDSLINSSSTEELRLERMKKEKLISGVANHHLYQLQICFNYEDYTNALYHIKEGEKVMHALAGSLFVVEFTLYSFLTITALISEMKYLEKRKALKQLKKNLKLMKKWAVHCPLNFLHLKLLMEAELARISGQIKEAMKLYNQSILTAQENKYPRYETLANELAAKFYISLGQEKVAKIYLKDAHYGYTRWGAIGKVHHLEKTYPKLFQISEPTHKPIEHSVITTQPSTTSGSKSSLDISSILKSSQTISREIILDKLLDRLMQIVIENAGATNGYFIIEKDDKFKIEIEVTLDDKEQIFQKTLEEKILDSENEIAPMSLIQYVSRTLEPVVLNNATREGLFTTDQYIVKKQPKSILCFPLVQQGKLSGIIYLENNLAIGAFTEERIEPLKILASQAAISIENARLYQNVENITRDKTIVETEMNIAKEIQTSLLPPEPSVSDFEVTAYMKTSDAVGGDYYDTIKENGREWFLIGDVSGHGVPAGLVMMMVQTSIHTVISYNPKVEPTNLLKKVNLVITKNIELMKMNKYMTITLFLKDKDGCLYYSGMHQDLVVYRKKIKKVETIETNGNWLGMAKIMNEFPIDKICFEQGDVLFLYTDGITEAIDKEENQFDLSGLVKFLEKNGEQNVEVIKEKFLDVFQNYSSDDDITFMILKRK